LEDTNVKLFCGIDWAKTHHDVAIINSDGGWVAKKPIPDDPQGFAQLVEMLAESGDNDDAPVPVAIETPRGLRSPPCGPRGGRCMRSTRWRSRGIASAIRWPGRVGPRPRDDIG
jgi:hypothetical protein